MNSIIFWLRGETEMSGSLLVALATLARSAMTAPKSPMMSMLVLQIATNRLFASKQSIWMS